MIVEQVSTSGDPRAPGFILLWAVINNNSRIGYHLRTGDVTAANPFEDIHSILAQPVVFIFARAKPTVPYGWIWVVEEVLERSKFFEGWIPEICIEGSDECRVITFLNILGRSVVG